MKKIVPYLLVSITFAVLAGCQSQDTASTKKAGSYTAARRKVIGSNIPQPTSADNVNSTLDGDNVARDTDRLTNASSSMRGGTGAR